MPPLNPIRDDPRQRDAALALLRDEAVTLFADRRGDIEPALVLHGLRRLPPGITLGGLALPARTTIVLIFARGPIPQEPDGGPLADRLFAKRLERRRGGRV